MDYSSVNWIPMGPAPEDLSSIGVTGGCAGRVTAIAVSGNFNGHGVPAMFIGTAGGGVWRSTDFQSLAPTWIPLTDRVPSQFAQDRQIGMLNIGALAVDPNHPSTIYAGTGDAAGAGPNAYGRGMLKSPDGGASWQLLDVGSFNFAPGFTRVFVDPTDLSGNTVYATGAHSNDSGSAPGRGVFKSTDAGATWKPIQGGLPNGVSVTDLDYTVVLNQLTLYAGIHDASGTDASANGIWVSGDGGNSWTQMMIAALVDIGTGGIVDNAHIGLIRIAADHNFGASNGVFAAIGNATKPLLLNVFKLVGTRWQPASSGLIAIRTASALSFGISMDDGSLYLGGVNDSRLNGLYRSADHGFSWASIDVGTNGVRPHTDHHAWFSYGGAIYNGNDGGIYRYNGPVGAGTWQSLNTPSLQTILTLGVGLHPQYPAVMLAGSQDNSIALRKSGVWSFKCAGDGYTGHWEPYDRNHAFATQLIDSGKFLFRSTDGGETWNTIDLAGSPRGPFGQAPFVFHPNVIGRMIVGLEGVHETSNHGDDGFKAISGALSGAGQFINALAYGGWDTIYASYGFQLFRTINDGADGWPEVGIGIDWHGAIQCLAVDPYARNRIFLGTSGGAVWYSADAGMTWTEITGDLPTDFGVNTLALRSEPGLAQPSIFAGTGVGVYATDNMSNWTRVGTAFPDANVTEIVFHPTTKYLVASTYGRGIFAAYMHFETPLGLGACVVSNSILNFALDRDLRICLNQAAYRHAFSGWFEVPGTVSGFPPAATAVGTYLFTAVTGPYGWLYINQGEFGHPFSGWQRDPGGLVSDVAPALAAVDNNLYLFVKTTDGRIQYNWAPLGKGGVGWKEVDGGGRTLLAPAACGISGHVFVAVTGLDGHLYVNQADLGHSFGAWFQDPSAPLSDTAPALAVVGNDIYFFVKGMDNRIYYNWARFRKGGVGWKEVEGGGSTNSAPAACGLNSSGAIFCFIRGLDDRIYLNQATAEQPFGFWFEVGGGL